MSAGLRRSTLGAFAAAVLVTGAFPPGVLAAPPAFSPPQPVEQTLENGLRVVVFEDARLPIVQIEVRIQGGVAGEREADLGSAHFTSQMLRRGTSTRSEAQFAGEMRALGASLTATTLRDYTMIGAGFLASDFDRGLDLIGDAVMHPAFSDEQIGRARYEIARTLLDLHANLVSTAEEQIWPLRMGSHPYGRPPAGTVPQVLQMTSAQVRAYYGRYYRPAGAVLCVAGNVHAADVFEAARTTFGSWSGQAEPVPTIVARPSSGATRLRIRIIDLPSGPRTDLRLATPAPEHGSRDYLSITTATQVFGRMAGSRLERSGVLPGVTGGLSSGYSALRDAGMFMVSAVARTDSAAQAITAIERAVRGLYEHPPDAAEVREAKRLQHDTWPLDMSTLGGLLGTWGEADQYGMADGALRGYASALDTIDADVVGHAVRHWIDPAQIVVLAVGPADRLRPLLEPLGDVEVVQLEGLPSVAWATREPTEQEFVRGREIVAAAITAHGGKDKIRRVKDSSLDGRVVFNAQGHDVEGRIRQIRKEPFRMRESINVFVFSSESVMDGNRGWLFESQKGKVEVADSLQLATMRSNFLSDVPHLLKQAVEEGARPIYWGQEQVGDRSTDVVEVRLQSDEKQIWLLFDHETHLLAASDVRGGIPPQVLARRVYSDYRDVKGLRLPYVERRIVQNTPVMRIEASQIGINIGIDESAFEAPEPK